MKKPPKLADWMLRRMHKYQENYAFAGDLQEIYEQIFNESGALKANLWYWHQVLFSYFRYLIYMMRWNVDMVKNYLKVAYRYYFQHKGITAVNIVGLSIGIAAFLLITFYIESEKSYDNFHKNSQNIYRVQYNLYQNSENKFQIAAAVPAIGPVLKDNFDEADEYSIVTREYLEYSAFSTKDNISFNESRVFFASPSFLTMFDFPFIQGDINNALTGPLKLVMTRTAARRYFGDEDPIGKILSFNQKHDFTVTGVCEDIPSNTHIKFDILLSWDSFPLITGYHNISGEEAKTNWNSRGFYTYLSLKPETDIHNFQAKMNQLIENIRSDDWKANRFRQEFILQPLEEIHLFSSVQDELSPQEQGNAEAVKVLSIIAAFILILAWINYINIATAHAMERAKEVSIRKVSGAFRQELIKQFMLEYIGLNLAALFIAVLLVAEFLPFFNRMTGSDLSFRLLFAAPLWYKLPAIFIMGTFLAGLYPAAVITAYKPAAILKGSLVKTASSIRIRKLLVTLQLAVSVALITGTFVIYRQMSYMFKQELNINMDHTLVVRAPGTNSPPPPVFADNFEAFRNEIQKQPRILSLSTTTAIPGEEILWGNFIRKAEDDSSASVEVRLVGIDYEFLPSFEIKILGGRNFSKSFPADDSAVILNEAAVDLLGYDNFELPVNQRVLMRGRERTIIGITENYSQLSPKESPVPLVYLLSPNRGFVTFKFKQDNSFYTLSSIKKIWQEIFPGIPFDYFFLDEFFNRHYLKDQRFTQIFTAFSVVVILIACLGLFSLSSINSIQRTKEIGIRKAMGANARNIYGLLSKEFQKLVTAAVVISIPFTYYQMNKWLENFIHRIKIEWWYFLLAWVSVALIVFLTVNYHTIKAASTHPVDALKQE